MRHRSRDLAGALADYSRALELNPNHASTYSNRGLAKAESGNRVAAIEDYTRALKIDPKLTLAYANRGNARENTGDVDGALADYNSVLAIDPTNVGIYLDRGRVKLNKADMAGAIADFTQAVTLAPDNPAGWFSRGVVRETQGDRIGALNDYTRTIEVDPKAYDAYFNRGIVRVAQGLYERALQDFRGTLELAPSDAMADYARLYSWLLQARLGKREAASTELRAEINQRGGGVDPWVVKLSEFLLGSRDERSLLAVARVPDPETARNQLCEAYFFAGAVRLLNGDRSGAIELLRSSVATGAVKNSEYRSAIGELERLR
jgi:tetratricopeptide (TPR) repeat protein